MWVMNPNLPGGLTLARGIAPPGRFRVVLIGSPEAQP